MAEANWPRHALRVGIFEFRRSVRAIRRDTARAGFMALGLVLPSLLFAGFTVLLADVIREAGTVALPDQLRGTVALFWLFATFIVAQRVAAARPRIDAEALVLTTVSARTAAVGLLLAETLRALTYLGLPVLTLTGALVYLFGSPASLVAFPLAAVLLAATAVVVGSVIGYAVAWLVATSRFVARHKTVLGVVVVLGFFGGYALVQIPGAGFAGQEALAWVPAGWLADLAVVGTPVTGSTTRLSVAVLGSLAVVVAGIAVVERETRALWFSEPVSVEDGDDDRPTGTGDGLTAAVRPLAIPRVVSTPTRRVAEWALLRTRRDPRRLTFLLMPVFFFGSSLISASVQRDALFALVAPLLAVVVPWMAGALFAMNPLGDEGRVLPVTLTAVSGRHYVRGLVLPGLLFGLPIVVLASVGAGLLSPYTPGQVLALALLGAYLTVASALLTPAVGMTFPRFSAIRIGQSRAVLPPRVTAVAVHLGLTVLPGAMLALLVVAPDVARTVLAGLLGYLPAVLLGLVGDPFSGLTAWFGGVGAAVQATGLARVRLVAGGVLIACGALVAGGAYRYAVGRFDRYDPT
jgi:ABC-2 type transport system permease protein